MNGIVFVESAEVEAATDHMLLTFESGDDKFRFRLSRHLARRFRHDVQRNGWAVDCAPDCEVLPIHESERLGNDAAP